MVFSCTRRRSGRSAKLLPNERNALDPPVIALTVDGPAPANWETLVRLRCTDTRQCDGCHGGGSHADVARRPNYWGIDVSDPASLNIATVIWDWIKRLRDTIKMKIVLTGILTQEDAKLAADNGIDGIIVSNHGGRVVDSGRATIEVLPEIIEAIGGRSPRSRGQRLPPGEQISSKPWPWARKRSASDGPIFGASAPSVSRVSSASSRSCVTRRTPPCSRSERDQSGISLPPWYRG